jgi:hypothetical protein
MPDGTRSEVSFTSDAFSPKIARSSFSSGVSWVSPFGRHLADQHVTGFDFGTDVDDARLVQARELRLAERGDVARDFLRTSLVSRATTVSSSMWIEVKRSSATTRSEIRIESSKL